MPALLVFGIFLITLAISIPIGISMVLGSVAPIFLLDVGGNIPQLLHNTFSGANNTPILAVPLFILGGVIMAEGGISKRLFNFFAYFVGRIPGGVPCAVILTCLFYGAISGSGPATTAAVGSMCIPFMVSLGYERRWSAGLIAVAGGLGVIIPPSIPFVLYSMATGVSTGDLFLGGVLPGILIGLFMMIYAVVHCLRKGEDKEKIRDKMTELKGRGLLRLFLDSFWALLCPVIILGGIYSGLFTPTEAACVSVFYAILVSLFIYKTIQLKDLIPFLCSSVKTYGGLAFVLAFATAFGRVLSMTKATQAVEAFIVSNFHSAALLLTCWCWCSCSWAWSWTPVRPSSSWPPSCCPPWRRWGWTRSTSASSWCAACPSALPRPPSAWTCSWPEICRRSPPWRWPGARSPLSSPS